MTELYEQELKLFLLVLDLETGTVRLISPVYWTFVYQL